MSKKSEWFGVVRWCDEDLENALEEKGLKVTKKKIAQLRKKLEHHSFTDYMIGAGWDYIYSAIDYLEG